MTATLAHIDATLFRAVKSGDAAAFEQLFRGWYTTLLEEASPIVNGDNAAAARAVESAFVQAWRARDRIPSADALEAGLHDATRDEAARIQSRREVAHHLDEIEGGHHAKPAVKPAPLPADVWRKVQRSMAVSAQRLAEDAHAAAVHSRHEAAGHLAELAKPRSRVPVILTAVAVIVVIGGMGLWALGERDVAALENGLAAENVRVTSTEPAQIRTLALDDGSSAQLGPNSELRVPAKFGTSMRGVALAGTAHFTVEGAKPRFLVRAGPAILTAIGTEFTVRAYPDERRVTVMVREGTVQVDVAGGESRTLTEGTGIVIRADSTLQPAAMTELTESVGWPGGTLVIADRPLREVLAEFKRWYGVELYVADTALLSQRVTMQAKVDSWEDASAALERATNLERAWAGSNMVLRPAGRRSGR
jgi:ferric-dicitrate binding protein FerR (iron transport regulator)